MARVRGTDTDTKCVYVYEYVCGVQISHMLCHRKDQRKFTNWRPPHQFFQIFFPLYHHLAN
jgi:hypothetical protein